MKKILCFITLFSLLFPFSRMIYANWHELQGNGSREGYIREKIHTPLTNSYNIEIGHPLVGSIIIVNNTVLYTCSDGTVGAFLLSSGKEIWRRKLPSTISSSATSSETELFIATEDGNIYALSINNGAILWNTPLNLTVKAPLMRFFRYLYVLSESGEVFSLNSFDGKNIWSSSVEGTLLTAPCIKQNYIYFVSREGNLYSLDAYNGRVFWVFEMDQTSRSTPIASTEIIVAGDDDGNVYGVDYLKGTSYYKKSLENAITTPFSFGYFDRRIIVSGGASSYTAFNASNGDIAWKYKIDQEATVPPVGASDNLWFPGKDNHLVSVGSVTGLKEFEIPLSSTASTSIALNNGRLVVGTEEGSIQVFSSKENDFTITMKPSDIGMVVPGETFIYDIQVLADDKFNDVIRFSVTGFPCACRDVQRYFDPPTIEGPGVVKLIVVTNRDTSPEQFSITINAVSFSGAQRSASSILSIQPSKDHNHFSFVMKQEVSSGTDFYADIEFSKALSVRSVQTIISFSNDHLFLRKIEKGDFFGKDSTDRSVHFDNYIDNNSGTAIIGLTKSDMGDKGSGVIARLYFRAKKSGNTSLSFLQASVRDSFLRESSFSASSLEFSIAKGNPKTIELTIAIPFIIIDGIEHPLDAPPIIQNGRTLVPIRRIAEELEAIVSWDATEEKVTLERFDKEIELWIGNPVCRINGIEQNLPSNVPPVIIKQRTFLPLRFVAEALDSKIEWFSDSQKIRITYPYYE